MIYLVLFLIIFIILAYPIFLQKDNIRFMNLVELLEYNIKLFLINNAGLTDINKRGEYVLEYMTNDPQLIKFHRRMRRKYGKLISTYMITKSHNYYILDTELAKSILKDSPKLFSAGKLKEDFFKLFMPKNVGITKCLKTTNCPWKRRRKFNEDALGTKRDIELFKCLPDIISRHIAKPLLNIRDFKNVSYKIIADMTYGNNGTDASIIKEFTSNMGNENFLKSKFYKEYTEHLHQHYNTKNKCSLLYYANLYKNDPIDIIDNQIPHWFSPFVFMTQYLIPNLLCSIINFKDIYDKIIIEISKPGFDILANNTYLHYCVIEHIRLFSTININIQRTVNKDMVYHGYKFKAGDQLFILFSSILRDGKLFDKPDSYIPERWIGKTVEEQDKVFGVGPQQCPSKRISPHYYKAMLYQLLSNYKYTSALPKLTSRELHIVNPYRIKLTVSS